MADLPDWFAASVIKGLYGTALKTVAVDSQGRIVMLPYGTVTVDGAVDVTQVEKDREIRGTDGSTLITLRVDALGRLIAMVKALYGTTVKDVQCDTNGNLTLNVKAQDLGEVINRPKYGACQAALGEITAAPGDTTVIFTVSGKGIIYSGVWWLDYTSSQKNSKPNLLIDGSGVVATSFAELFKYGITEPAAHLVRLLVYDDANFIYSAGFSYGITFESSFTVRYTESHGTTPDVLALFHYALV